MRTNTLLATLLFTALTPTCVGADILFPGDPQNWRIAGDDWSGPVHTVELLRPGKSFGNSAEILVIAKGPGDDASTAAEDYLQDLKGACDDGHYEFIRSGWEDTVYTWDPRGCDMPEAELEEVGRFMVEGNKVIRLTLRIRQSSRVGFWRGWVSGRYGNYSSWIGPLEGAPASRRPVADDDAPSSDICDDDDLDCLLRVQRQQVDTLERINDDLEAMTGNGSRRGNPSGGNSGRANGSRDGGSRQAGTQCCSVRQVHGLHLQRQHPNVTRDERVSTFRSTDTYIYAIAELGGVRGGSSVTFRWFKIDADGDETPVTSRDVDLEGGATYVYGSLYYTGLTPLGDYRVDVYYDGDFAGSLEFRVVAGSSFG